VEKASDLMLGIHLAPDIKLAEMFETLIIFLNDILTIVKMYDEEFTVEILRKFKEATEGVPD
jgi:hypothetical protein